MSFVSASIQVDPDQMLDDGVDSINANLAANSMPGWTAADATLAVLVLATIAQMFADVANVAATMLPALFRAVGTQLFGVPYNNGATASVLSTWTFTAPAPTGGYSIEAQLVVNIDGAAFYTQAPYTSGTGDTTAVITLVASQVGTIYNELGGVSAGYPSVQLQNGIDFVTSVVTQGLTSGGQDQETDPDYQNRLVAELELQAPRPVVDADFATFVQTDTAEQATGVAVGRATSIDGYYPSGRALSTGGTTSPTTLTGALTTTSPTVYYTAAGGQVPEIGATVTGTGVPGGTTVLGTPAPTDSSFTLSANATTTASETLTVSAMSGYGPPPLTCSGTLTSGSAGVTIVTAPYPGAIPDIGARVTGTAVPNGTTVLASPTPTTAGFHLSANATSNETAETLNISSWTSVSLAETTFITDVSGDALTAANMDAELAWLETYRPQNWLLSVTAPTYTPIYVTALVAVLPNYDQTSVGAAVQAALLTWLSSASWGNQLNTTGTWLNTPVVRYKQALAIAGNPDLGVAYVDTLTLGTSPSPGGTSDIVLAGPAPLVTSSAGGILITTEAAAT